MTATPLALHHGNNLDVLPTLPDCSIDSIVTDPPYELGFMGKKWDASGIAYNVDLWRECLRVLKPGGHLLAFGGTRTYHRMAVAIEDAGFEVRDSIHWLYGSGFPKSLDVSKAIDKAAGAEREVVGATRRGAQSDSTGRYGAWGDGITPTAPATDAARRWAGWGTALKPAHEPIVVARKPLDGTVAANVLQHGTGALNIDGCRVGSIVETWPTTRAYSRHDTGNKIKVSAQSTGDAPAGRWPANIVLTHAADCADTCAPDCPVAELDRQSGVSVARAAVMPLPKGHAFAGSTYGSDSRGNGESLQGFNDTGGASRFFTVTDWGAFRYVAKPGKAERNVGLDRLIAVATHRYGEGVGTAGAPLDRNFHPTVKPLDLMRWLVRLVTPPDGTVLDPFAGSGTTLVAARLEGFAAVGIEMTADYLPIIKGRLAWAAEQPQQLQLFTEGDAA